MGDLSPLRISLEIALISTILTFITGVTMAYRIGRLGRGKNIIDSLLSLPLVLPPTVTGFLLLLLFGKNSPVGRFLAEIGISVIFTFPGAVIAAFVTSFPIMYRTARGAFELVDTELIDAAKTLGYGNRGILFKVVLPLSWPALSSGAVLSFARALGEFGATIMVAGNIEGKTRTMSTAVYTAVQSGNRELAVLWVLIILTLSFVILIIMNLILNKGFGRE